MKLKSILVVCAVFAMAAICFGAVPANREANVAWMSPADHPDFSGTWKADMAKSDFGPMGGPDEQINVIDHKDPKLKIKTSIKGGPRPGESESNYMTDGTESTNKRGEMEIKSTGKWDGKKLVLDNKLNAQGMDINIKATYELSEDGKAMTISSVISTPQGDFNSKIVFNKAD